MKKLLSFFALMLFCISFALSQSSSNGNANGNGNNNGNGGNGNNGNGNGNGAGINLCGVAMQPGEILNECFNGNGLGNCPYKMSLVTDVLKAARAQYPASFPQGLGLIIQQYHDCSCVITYLGGRYFRVQLSGDVMIILVDGI
jgi:hypothetical protein